MGKEALAQLCEALGDVTHEKFQGSGGRTRFRIAGGEVLRDCLGEDERAVDQLNLGTHHVADRLLQDRVVRAAEDEGVDVRLAQFLEISPGDGEGDPSVDPAFLGQGHEEWTGLAGHVDAGPRRAKQLPVAIRRQRGEGPDDADPARGRPERGFDPGLDHSVDGKIGEPVVKGAKVAAKVVAQKRGPKITVFKKKRRQNYRRKKGHRQPLTLVQITDIKAA